MTLEAIRTIRAVRQFSDRPVPEEIIRTILNAGRRSQSSRNTQPWDFVVIRNRDLLKKLSECGNYAGHVAGAAFAVALITPGGSEFDLGQAAAYMQLTAWEQGVASCYASIWEPDRAKTLLGVPDDMRFNLAISFGYPASTPESALKKGGRRAFDEVVHWEKW